jgi:hypothetical protein
VGNRVRQRQDIVRGEQLHDVGRELARRIDRRGPGCHLRVRQLPDRIPKRALLIVQPDGHASMLPHERMTTELADAGTSAFEGLSL